MADRIPSWAISIIDDFEKTKDGNWVDSGITEVVQRALQVIRQEGTAFDVEKFVEDNMLRSEEALLWWAYTVHQASWYKEHCLTADYPKEAGNPIHAFLEVQYRVFLNLVGRTVFEAWRTYVGTSNDMPGWLEDVVHSLRRGRRRDIVPPTPWIRQTVWLAYRIIEQEKDDFDEGRFIKANRVKDLGELLRWASEVYKTNLFTEGDDPEGACNSCQIVVHTALETHYETALRKIAGEVFKAWKARNGSPDEQA